MFLQIPQCLVDHLKHRLSYFFKCCVVRLSFLFIQFYIRELHLADNYVLFYSCSLAPCDALLTEFSSEAEEKPRYCILLPFICILTSPL